MIINYLKLALRVLMKKKFFTFISLFGISITLMVLTLFASFVESQMGANPPMSDKDKMVFIDRIVLKKMVPDTIITIDTIYEENITRFDTTYVFSEMTRNTSSSSFSYHFLDTYMNDIENVAKYSFCSTHHTFDVFVNNTKLTLSGIYTDATYFDIFDFVFLEGSAWDKKALDNQMQVAVMTDKSAIKYFGTIEKIAGREVVIENKHYKITGLVSAPPATLNYLRGDLFIPYTNMEASTFKKDNYLGSFMGCFVGNSSADIPLIKEQIAYKGSDVSPVGENWEFNHSEVQGETFGESFAQGIIHESDAAKSKRVLLIIVSVLLSLFVLLPILNLIKINVSRIMDRSVEIGVRKAFGANRNDIILQFIFENVVLTVLGGAIGFVFTLVVVRILNETQALAPVVLFVNYKVLIYSIIFAIFFGVLSGLAPALKMSRIHIVNALNKNNA